MLAESGGGRMRFQPSRQPTRDLSPEPSGYYKAVLGHGAMISAGEFVQANGTWVKTEPPTSPPAAVPYKRTSVFDENTLPAGLRGEHRTRARRVGRHPGARCRLRYQVLDPASEVILEPCHPGLVLLDQPHRVEPLGPTRMQVEFYNQLPDL